MVSVEAMREHYVRTADAWIENLENNWDAAVELIGEESARVWRLYLAGGRLAFERGRMGVDQILLAR
jgi:cyclopropane-fatty-acyl-phospholipid synthase